MDHNTIVVLSAIKDGSVDSLKFCLNSGMFPNSTDVEGDTKNSLHCMCGIAAIYGNDAVLRFILDEVVFKCENVQDVIFKCAIAIFRANNDRMCDVLLKSTFDFFKVTTLDVASFSARCMREFSQEAALVQNKHMLYSIWDNRDKFPIEERVLASDGMRVGKDREFLPSIITAAVFYDDVELIRYGLTLPNRWQEYVDQCITTWFRMSMEGHSVKVARILFPYIKRFIETNEEYASIVLKDSMRTGCYDLHLEISQLILSLQKNTP